MIVNTIELLIIKNYLTQTNRAKSKNFQGLVFTPTRDKLLLWALK